ncbi:hypothetical protein BHYA_0028g00170 [Botrytis hyacinthi]|uniref:Uncharacterized protein n=1 Tax=Botrytis hyacinthi TaxID=278943 RepID=A0A4Z1GVN2_9HELO|nr:hypothetical protein BHYA_0028g00170 [Botrytis hyacinthi]
MSDHNQIETFCEGVASGRFEHPPEFWKQKENCKVVERQCGYCCFQLGEIKLKKEKEAAENVAREAKAQADRAKANAAYQANQVRFARY